MAEENVVYVGKKGVMPYVLAVVTQFSSGSDKVTIKARGKLISRAVDVAEIVRNKFLQNVEIEKITTATEEIVGKDGQPAKVSTITIVLSKS